MTATMITMTLNGRTVTGDAEPRTHLADFIREEQLLTGTHLGCEQGVCGACTIFVDGRPVRSCITMAAACEGRDVRTVEGFDDDPLMAQLREAFSRHHALQCGYCTPGMLATAYDIVRRLPGADTERIRRELSGNLCRCTGYQGIVAAVEAVIAEGPREATVTPRPRRGQTSARTLTTAPPSTAARLPAVTARTPGTTIVFEDLAGPEALEGAARLDKSVVVDAPADRVWAMLHDLDRVAAAIPGAVLDGPPAGEAFSGRYAVALGPVTARFSGEGAMRLDEAARTGRVVGRGRDPISRTALDGALDFAVVPAGERAQLDLAIAFRLKGPLAQFGRPALVEAIADNVLAETAANLARAARGEALDGAATSRPAGGLSLLGSALRRLLAGLFARGKG